MEKKKKREKEKKNSFTKKFCQDEKTTNTGNEKENENVSKKFLLIVIANFHNKNKIFCHVTH